MNDIPQMPLIEIKAIILFDGTCGLCDRAVQFILKHDRAKRFHFAPLQSDTGKNLLQQHGIDPAKIDSIVLIEGDRSFTKSTAALKIALELNDPWPLFGLLGFIPLDWRDAVYDYLARHRHQWFKPRETCTVPDVSDRERFIS